MKKFYCQDCGKEVSLNAKKCPSCHKEFGSILCPKCYYSGNSLEFGDGCPECGYLKKKEFDVDHGSIRRVSRLSLKLFVTLLLPLISIIFILIYLLKH